MIYFLQAGGQRGPIKIGFIDHPGRMEERRIALQAGNAEELFVVASLPGDLRRERELHERFCEGRIRGEWFRWDTPGLRELVFEALQQEALRLTGHCMRYCSWCKVNLVRPPRRKVCSWECEQASKRASSRAWRDEIHQ